MGRERIHTPDLFSTTAVVELASPPTKQASATEAPADTTSQRILPKDLPNAVKHLTDRELDLLITASVDEAKRRGRLPPSVRANTPDESIPKRLSSKDKPQAKLSTVSLTRGQINAVRAAFKAGITPA